ncbi:hypothetical protein PTKIN_Ptkin07bG0108300 [Pterospermum kingtungense]
MSSSETETNSDSSSSNNDSLSMTKQLLDEPSEDDCCTKMTRDLVQTTAIYVPMIISTMFKGKKLAHGGSTPGRHYIRRDRRERHDLIINDYFKVRMLAYGCSADLLDEYVQIGKSTAIESLKRFYDAVIGFLNNNI